ncbi:hypothetical protein ACU635_08625 [[Actinomadura] parvosata]|uniref:hypothetical protein n=1 Tax=[Actinomadura] parvosata TaxID=1955412 RepID=UPI00406C9FB4
MPRRSGVLRWSAGMKRALARQAANTYVLGSAEKIGAASRFAVLPLTEVAGIVADVDPGHPTLRALSVPILHAP